MQAYINLKNGDQIDAMQWKDNPKDLPFNDQLKRNDLEDYKGKFPLYKIDNKGNLHFNTSKRCKDWLANCELDFGYFINKSVIKKNDFIVDSMSDYEYLVIPNHDFKKHYGLANGKGSEYVNKKTEKHYQVITWHGSFTNFVPYLSSSPQLTLKLGKDKSLHIYNSDTNKTTIAKLGDKLILDVDLLDDVSLSVYSPKNFKAKFTPVKQFNKKFKLPKYLFVITETTGEYSDADTTPIRVTNSKSKAKNIIDNLEDKYDEDETFDVVPVSTKTNADMPSISDDISNDNE